MNASTPREPLVLYVEDHDGVRYAMARSMRDSGLQVVEARTGREALALARSLPDAIVLDLHLPDMSGFDVSRQLKADVATASIPVLHLTSTYEGVEHRVAGLEAGADGYLTHPVEPIVLIASIRALLRARAAEAELRRAEQQWRRTFDAIGEGIALLDTSGRLLRCNAALGALLRRAPEELAGTDAYTYVPAEARPANGWPFERMLESRVRESSEVSLGSRWFRITCDPWLDDGTFRGAVVVVSDVTYRKQAEEARLRSEREREQLLEREQAARRDAENANRLKDEFLATLSHELRTPLNAIVGWTHVVKSGLDAEATARGIDAIERNARMQSQLISDILDVSRIIRGQLRLDLSKASLQRVVESALESVKPAADAKRLRIEVSLDPTIPQLLCDPDRLQQVAWNLLSNAIKFSDPGREVRVALEPAPQGVRLTVADEGAGIEPEFLPHVFERFRQGDVSTTRRQGGLGLGLAIVRHFVELHGGAAYAHSAGRGRGATFIVELPMVARAQPADPPVPPAAAGGAEAGSRPLAPPVRLDGRRVLVVDDDRDGLDLIGAILRQRGAVVDLAASVDAARAAFERHPADVVVSDIGMPDEDGFALVRWLRTLPPERGGRRPVVALTAYVEAAHDPRFLRAGFHAHLPKPVEPERLVGAIVSSLVAAPRE